MGCFKLETPGFLHGGYMLLPEDESKQYPIMYMIHGTGGCIEWVKAREGASPDQCVNIANMMEELVNSGKAEPAIIVMPQMPYYNGSWNDFYNYDILNLMEQVHNKYSHIIKPGRENTVIGGFSLGSTVALKNAIGYSDIFGSVCIVSMTNLMYQCIDATTISTYEPQEGTFLYLGYGLGESYDFIKIDEFLADSLGSHSKAEYRYMLRKVQGGHNFHTFNPLFREFFSNVFKDT